MSDENRVPLKPELGAWPVFPSSYLLMNRLNKIEFAIFISLMWSLLPQDLTNQNLLVYLLLIVFTFPAFKHLSHCLCVRQLYLFIIQDSFIRYLTFHFCRIIALDFYLH